MGAMLSGRFGRLVPVGLLLAVLLGNMRLLERRLAAEPANIMVGDAQIPPTLALTTFALGPLRGLIVDGLWWRLIQQQDRGHFFETIQLTDWITALQPRFPQVWAFNAWNLSYNVAHEFPDPAVRWKWIERSIRLLRDQGLTYNPGDPIIRKELTRLFLDRIGKRGDPAQAVFKQFWAEEVMRYLPQGNRGELELLSELLQAGERIYAEADVAELLGAAAAAGLEVRRPAAVIAIPREDSRLAGILDSEARAAAWQRLLHYSRARELERDLGYSLARMCFIDQEYGPFDWRLPQAHAVYWSVGGELSFSEFLAGDDSQLHVMTRQAMEQAFHSGRLIYDPDTTFFMVSNNLHIVGKIHDYYDRLLETTGAENTHHLHREFLANAAAILYSHQYIGAARQLYAHFAEDYGQRPEAASFERFIAHNMHRVLGGGDYSDSRAMVHAALFQAYFWTAVGDPRRAQGYLRLGRLAYDRHQARYAASPGSLLPSFAELKQGALAELRSRPLAALLQHRLEGEPELSAADTAAAEEALYLGRSLSGAAAAPVPEG